MTGGDAFDLLTEWRLAAPVEIVWPVIRDVEAWPDWWPCVARIDRIESGDPDGIGARHRVVWTTALPYRLALETEVVAVEPLRRIEIAAAGELEGSGLWTFAAEAGGTRLAYRWRVRPRKNWMRRLTPVLRPVFAWNHDWVMERGRGGLEKRLAAPTAALPVG